MSDARKTRFSFNDWEKFPPFALSYFAWSLLAIVLGMLVLDRCLLPHLENLGLLACEEWKIQNEHIWQLMKDRNHASSSNPIWTSDAFTVREKCSKSKRILVLGDSYVWGHGVANLNLLWWRQLQKELARRGYDNVEVISAGMCGATTHAELDWLPQLITKYHPDLLIWSYVVNDPEEFEGGRTIVPSKPAVVKTVYSGIAGFLHPYFPNLVYHLLSLRIEREKTRFSDWKNGYYWDDWELKILEGRNFELYKMTMQKVGTFVRSSHIPQFFVPMVSPELEKYRTRLVPVENLMKENGIQYLDFLDDMVSWYRDRFAGVPGKPAFVLGTSPVDAHPGPIATHYYAVKTADFLERKYPEFLGPKTHLEKRKTDLEINDWLPDFMDLQKTGPGTFSFTYPPADFDKFLKMPIRRKYVQFNLTNALALKQVQIRGNKLVTAALSLSYEDPASGEFLVGKIEDCGFRKGKSVFFNVPDNGNLIAELRISAEFEENSGDDHHPDDRQLDLKLVERK